MQLDLGRGDVRGGAVGVAVGAGVVAEMADEGPLIGVGGAAAAAVLGVVGVLELGKRLARVLDPEVGDAGAPAKLAVAAEVGDQRVVGVEGELAGSLQRGDQLRPLVGEALQLAVAVELVAEEVAEDEQARARAGGRRGAARPRRARRGPRRRTARAGPSRPPSACSSRRGCGPAGARRAAGSPRSSPPWSSCRWSS